MKPLQARVQLWQKALVVTLALCVVPSHALAQRSHGSASTKKTQEAPKTVKELLSRFSTMPGLEAHFSETKTLSLLKKPIASRGVFYFLPPSTLIRRISSPSREQTVISQKRITRVSGAQSKSIDLRTSPEFQPLAKAVLWLFSGNETALRKAFRIAYKASGDRYELTLKPKSAQLQRLLSSISIDGKGYAAKRVTVVERNGDRTVTDITKTDPERRFSRAERARLLKGAPKAQGE